MLKPRYLLSAAVLLLLAWMLNPDAEQHRQHIKTVVAQRSQLENFLGLGDLTAFASSYHSLGLFSYTKVNQQLITLGMFNLVFMLD